MEDRGVDRLDSNARFVCGDGSSCLQTGKTILLKRKGRHTVGPGTLVVLATSEVHLAVTSNLEQALDKEGEEISFRLEGVGKACTGVGFGRCLISTVRLAGARRVVIVAVGIAVTTVVVVTVAPMVIVAVRVAVEYSVMVVQTGFVMVS
jgi:hypothetical protein